VAFGTRIMGLTRVAYNNWSNVFALVQPLVVLVAKKTFCDICGILQVCFR